MRISEQSVSIPGMVPGVLEMIRALVAMRSASSFDPKRDEGNRGVTNLLASWLEDVGCDVVICELAGESDRANLVARLGTGEGGLILSGHSDTVACESGKWTRDPYKVREDGGRLYGLGIADMKSFFALAIEALRAIPASKLREPVFVVATADEECAMAGIRALVAGKLLQGRYAIVGEPTSLLPVRMHKGMLMESIRLVGRSGHSSVPATGVSALEGMHTVLETLLAWREELQHNHRDTGFEVPHPTLNLGTIHGGDHPNRICGECELQIDLRVLPGMELQGLHAELRTRVARALTGSRLQLEIRSLFPGTEPFRTRPNSEIVRIAEQLTGETAGSVAYGTEAPHFAGLGIETVLLGPGDIAQAHQPDEYLAVERIEPGVALLRKIIERVCC